MNKDGNIGSEVIVEPLSGLCWKVYTAMRTVALIDRTPELTMPAGIVQTDAVADEGHPISNVRFIVFCAIGIEARQHLRALLSAKIIQSSRCRTPFAHVTCNAIGHKEFFILFVVVTHLLLGQIDVDIGRPITSTRSVVHISSLLTGNIDRFEVPCSNVSNKRARKIGGAHLPTVYSPTHGNVLLHRGV